MRRVAGRKEWQQWIVAAVLATVSSTQAAGQFNPPPADCTNDPGHLIFKDLETETNARSINCSATYRCYLGQTVSEPIIRLRSAGCDPHAGNCEVEIAVTLRFPGNRQNIDDYGLSASATPMLFWYRGGTPPACDPTSSQSCLDDAVGVCGQSGLDGKLNWDLVETFLRATTSCAALKDGPPNSRFGVFSILGYTCATGPSGCRLRHELSDLVFTAQKIARAIGCPNPRKEECEDCLGNLFDPSGAKTPKGGDAICVDPSLAGPGARLRYAGRGAGHPNHPGTTEWNQVLGRYWSHDYAERIVVDPDEDHVWLITKSATFGEFTKSSAETVYPRSGVSPSDEYRTLEKTVAGWTLTDLDGTVTAFDSAGLWLSTTDRNGNVTAGTYIGGKLTSVDFPDGRREDFTYYDEGAGLLETITEVGVNGETRTWTYFWDGLDLERIERPDGTAWVFGYDDPAHPGYMTLMELEGTDFDTRVARGWEYDAEGNAYRTWKGALTFDHAEAVDRWELAFDDPTLPTVTTVTDPRGNVATYTIGRDPASTNPRVESISGDCPACGLGPNVQLVYEDAANPLRPTREVDGDGTETHYTYDAHGQVLTKTEAANTVLARTMSWEYDPNYPALVTEVEQPSVDGIGLRRTKIQRDPAGNPTHRWTEGVEGGSTVLVCPAMSPDEVCYQTVTTFNVGGQPLSVDPPGYGTDDVIDFVYDPGRGNGFLVLESRTDGVGTTTFEHDGFNRRTAVTDPNGLRVETEYDLLDRVETIIQRGPTAAEDLVTDHEYNPFGDLRLTTLPEGNVLEYEYDLARRLEAIQRRPDATTPAERTSYELDPAGNRIREELQLWDASSSSWVAQSFTEFLYTTRCRLDRVTHADGTATEYAYDCNGNLERVWDANHPRFPADPPPPPPPPGDADPPASTFAASHVEAPPTQVYAYDALDRLARLRQPWPEYAAGWDDPDPANEAVTDYGYDVQDHLTSLTDAEGNTTSYVYSDRDLLTEEVSPVSGTTTHAYNEHGELVETVDARGILVTRIVDALDRVTSVDYPDPALDTTYDYDDPAVDFSLGRLTEISRPNTTITYAYDAFGRPTQDGALGYDYDRNGNRIEIAYPGGVVARYDFDFADRETTAELQVGADPPQPLVTAASYLPSGPPSSLDLGNGLTETRGFDARYHPTSIDLAGIATLTYTTDAVGNVTRIDRTVDADIFSLAYAYQDGAYFLTEGGGPWGRLAWTYDRIGNRLTEGAGGGGGDLGPTTYHYEENATGPPGAGSATGNTPKLVRVELGPDDSDTGTTSTHTYGYDDAGNLTSIQPAPTPPDGASALAYDDASRLAGLDTDFGTASTAVTYDGRGFLAVSETTYGGSSDLRRTTATYSSEGLLHARRQEVELAATHPDGDEGSGGGTTSIDETTYLVYFAGRPLAQLTRDGLATAADRLLYLTTDHLGTPIAATDPAGQPLWQGGLSPFGEPYTFGPGGDGGDGDPQSPDGDDPDTPPTDPPPPDPPPPGDDGRPPGSEPGTPGEGGGDDCEGADCDDGRNGAPPGGGGGGDDCAGPDCDDGRGGTDPPGGDPGDGRDGTSPGGGGGGDGGGDGGDGRLPGSEPGTPGETDPPPPCDDPSCQGRLVYVVPAPALAASPEEAGIFLRFPGQWDDPTFDAAQVPEGIYYNVHRWYAPATGRYTRTDPLGVEGDSHPYLYATANPLLLVDALGLKGRVGICCKSLADPLSAFQHCYIRRIDDDSGEATTIGMHTAQNIGNFIAATFLYTVSEIEVNHPFDFRRNPGTCRLRPDPCDEVAECVLQASATYPSPAYYSITGPNSNTFAGNVARQCNLGTPPIAGTWQTLGWHDAPPARFGGRR